jgi:hypothetical protein
VPSSDDGPGVGPVVALTYRATVDVPARFITVYNWVGVGFLRRGWINP